MTSPFKISLNIAEEGQEETAFAFRLHTIPENEPSIYPEPEKIFVVSDIEGNFTQLLKLLTAAGVINRASEWCFERGHLVILGDCFDRGEQVTECLWLIYGLEEKARRQGGYVHFILGNHEIMNMNGDWRYIHPRYAVKCPFPQYPPTALYYGNAELWKWLRTKNVIERIGKYLFVHGGVSEEVLNLKLSLQEINTICRNYYQAKEEETASIPIVKTLFGYYTAPFWYRGYYIDTTDNKLIKRTLVQYDSKAIITGHTMLEQITSFFGKRLFNVNTDHANKRSEGLIIIKKKFYRIWVNGKFEKIT